MMDEVGCYIRNDFYFKASAMLESNSYESYTMSSIDCANACSYAVAVAAVPSSLCSEGWSYQIATKRCYFLNQVNVTILQPNSHLMEKDMTIGWATGLRSCSEPGRSDTRTRTARGRGWWGPQQHQPVPTPTTRTACGPGRKYS